MVKVKKDIGGTMFFHKNIIELAKENSYFRHVLFTTQRSQLVLMSLQEGEEIGKETHNGDQLLFFVEGEGQAILNGEASPVHPGYSVIVPAGTQHNFKNIGTTALKLFTVYTPAQHEQGLIHKTKAEALKEEKY